jgi:hypothetical protein
LLFKQVCRNDCLLPLSPHLRARLIRYDTQDGGLNSRLDRSILKHWIGSFHTSIVVSSCDGTTRHADGIVTGESTGPA